MSLRTFVPVIALLLGGSAVLSQITPSYSNTDLERVQPYRDQTGVSSVPAFLPEPLRPEPKPRAARGAAQDEAYWRQEARHVRERQRVLDEQLERLRAALDRPRPAARGRSRQSGDASAQDARLKQRIAALEQRKRELESDLDDRARRARVLPGWLR